MIGTSGGDLTRRPLAAVPTPEDVGTATRPGSDPLRIALVTLNYAPEQTGVAPYSTSMAEGLAARGHDVTVVAAAPHYPGWRTLPKSAWAAAEQAGGVHVIRLTSWVPKRPTYVARTLFEVLYGLRLAARTFRDFDVVALVSPALFASVVVRLRLAMMGSHRPLTVLWMQDLYGAGMSEARGPAGRRLGTVLRAVEGALARACDRTVVIHRRFRDYVVNDLGLPEHRVTVIRNWTHVSPPSGGDRQQVRQDRGWRRDETVVLHAGAIGAKQDLGNVITAARLVDEQDLPIRFVLLGDGSQRAALEESAVGCQRIEFIDPLPDDQFGATLAAADLLLVNERPGVQEAAVPSKLTTYFSTGLPVLAATEPDSTTAEEIRDSGAGLLAPPGDPAALVQRILDLRARPDMVDGQAGPSYVQRLLSPEAAITAFDATIRS